MRLLNLLAGTMVAVLVAQAALAAAPPSHSGYQVNLGNYPVPPTYVPGYVPMWLDSTTVITNPDGSTFALPRPTSDQSPMPVAIIGGSGGTTQGTTPWQDNIAQFGGVTVNIGQQVRAASIPVTLASDQPAIPVSQSGTWNNNLYIGGAANAASNPAFAQLTAGSAAIGTVGVTALPSLPAGSATIGSVTVSNFPATQPVSGTITLSAGSAIAGKVGIDQTTPGTTNGVQVNNFPSTQPVSATSLPLPAGAATSANQATPTAPGTSSTTQANPVQGVTGGVALNVSEAPTAAAANGMAGSSTISSSLVLKASAGNLYDAYAVPSAAGFLAVINATSAPASGSAINPVECVPIASGAQGGVVYNSIPEVYSTGIVVLLSTGSCTGGTVTYTALSGFIHGRAK